jgi:hypothetical protein
VLALAVLIAALVFIAQHRFPVQTTPPVPPLRIPGAPAPPKAGQSSSTGVMTAIFINVFTSILPTSASPATTPPAVLLRVVGDGRIKAWGS